MAQLLSVNSIPQNTSLQQAGEENYRHVSVDDPATLVMTDFSKTKALTIAASESMDYVNEKMMAYGVRLLFVMQDDHLAGVITSTDILGNKPLLLVTERSWAREEIAAKDLMTSIAHLEAVQFSELAASSVGDIVETMKQVNRQHMLVLEGEENPIIRGLLSMTQIGKQLGVAVRTSGRATHFSDFAAL